MPPKMMPTWATIATKYLSQSRRFEIISTARTNPIPKTATSISIQYGLATSRFAEIVRQLSEINLLCFRAGALLRWSSPGCKGEARLYEGAASFEKALLNLRDPNAVSPW